MQTIDGCLVTTAVDTDTIVKQIQENNKLGLQNVADMEDFREGKPIAIVGGGPSLKDTLDELRSFPGPVMACGSVHDYLVDNNVNIKWCVLCDPDPLITKYMKKQPKESCKYLVASQCHPEIFEYLKKFDTSYYNMPNYKGVENKNPVYIWHAGGDKFDVTNFGENQVIIGGGCTVGTRAINLAMTFGYYNIHLFGFDSCLTNDYKHHTYEFETSEETIGSIHEIRLGGPDSPIFKVAGYMLGQIFDFKSILKIYGDRTQFTVHGEGALKYIMDLAKKHYLETKELK